MTQILEYIPIATNFSFKKNYIIKLAVLVHEHLE